MPLLSLTSEVEDDSLPPASPPKTVASRDSYVVASEPLSGLISGYLRDRVSDRLPKDQALAHLSAASGVSRRTIATVVAKDNRTTEWRIADALVTAMDCMEAFYDGTLEVVPNRILNASKQEALRAALESEHED